MRPFGPVTCEDVLAVERDMPPIAIRWEVHVREQPLKSGLAAQRLERRLGEQERQLAVPYPMAFVQHLHSRLVISKTCVRSGHAKERESWLEVEFAPQRCTETPACVVST
jgi:hypothetical protein